jgi:hypothetical protein
MLQTVDMISFCNLFKSLKGRAFAQAPMGGAMQRDSVFFVLNLSAQRISYCNLFLVAAWSVRQGGGKTN